MRTISIVMPSFNTKKHLERSIQAFLDQDYENKRLIIVDGKSTDGSHDIISRFAAENKCVEWITELDTGLSNAMNIGLSHMADDDLFGFLGSDDILLPGTLRKAAELMHYSTGLIGVYFDSYVEMANNEMHLRHCPVNTMSLENLVKHGTVAGFQNTYLDAKKVKAYKIEEKSKYAMDYELYLRLVTDGFDHKIVRIPHPSSINIQDGNITSIYWEQSSAEAAEFAKKYGGEIYDRVHNKSKFRFRFSARKLKKKINKIFNK